MVAAATKLKGPCSLEGELWQSIVAQSLSHVWLCNPLDCSRPGFPVLYYLLELAQSHVHDKLSILKSRDYHFANKCPYGQNYGFSTSHEQMWDHKEGWVPKNRGFWTVVLEKTLESPLDCKEVQPVHPKGNQSLIFIGRTHAEAESPILCPLDAKSQLTGKDPDAGKDWGQEEKGTTEEEMAGWHHRLDGHGFEQTLEMAWWEAQRSTENPGELQSMELQRIGHDLVTEHYISFC